MSASVSVGETERAIRALARHYRSGQADLASAFFGPCLAACKRYRRAVGYFSTSALKTWAAILPRLAENETALIQLLIAPILSTEDKDALARATDEQQQDELRQIVADRIVSETFQFVANPEDVELRLKLFAWFVANNRIELKFAFPRHTDPAGIYHEKIGIFDFPWGDRLAFVGSANETSGGHSLNFEVVHVYRSWDSADADRVDATVEDFEQAWQDRAPGLRVIPLSARALQTVRAYAPAERPTVPPQNDVKDDLRHESRRWRHQEEAVSAFLRERHGVLEMATGTGKTRTALEILTTLADRRDVIGAIVTTDGNDLLDQWYEALLAWAQQRTLSFRIFRHFGDHHQMQSFALDADGAILVIARQQLHRLLKMLDATLKKRLLLVHDEVHGLGSDVLRSQLVGTHSEFPYRLGLSATPERVYDVEGSSFIASEIGSIIYRFGLREAIERGILCEFDYVPLPYTLTDNDRRRLQQVFAWKAAREGQGANVSNEELWVALARVYKTAEMKPAIFERYLKDHPEIVRSTIIFVETREYGERLLPILHGHTHLYRTYYADDERSNLLAFANGTIDCLVTCHRISQGIDIRNLKHVVLFAAARAKLETIQRIGRSLRVDPRNPQKRAQIIDFVREEDEEDADPAMNPDRERSEWLQELSRTRRRE